MKKRSSKPVEVEVLPEDTILPEETKTKLTELVVANELAQDTALSLQNSFAPFFVNAKKVLEQSRKIVITTADQKAEMKVAREYRLELRKIRVESDKVRKTLKEDSLRRSRAIDGFYNILLDLTETEEKRLKEQEEFIERQEAARKQALIERRQAELVVYGIDTTFYQLGDMTEDAYQGLLANTKLAYEAKLAAEKKAEEDRIAREKAEAEERERIRRENERLKVEAAKVEEERRAAEEKLRKERQAAEAKAKAEQEARKRAEEELRKAKEAEEARLAAEEEARAKAEQAPDREKLLTLAVNLRTWEFPAMKSKKGKSLIEQVQKAIEKIAYQLEEKAKTL